MKGAARTGSPQVLALLLTTGAFGTLIGSVGAGRGGEAVLPAALFLRLLWELLLLLPGLWLLVCGAEKAFRAPAALKRAAAFAAALLFGLSAAQTAASFSSFLHEAVYEAGTPPGLGAALLWVAAVYAAQAGIAAQGRFAWCVLWLLGLGVVAVGLTLAPELRALPPSLAFSKSLLTSLRASGGLLFGQRAPLLVYPLLCCLREPKKGAPAALGALALVTALEAAAVCAVSGVLGAFGALRAYPVYTLAGLSGFGVLERLDPLYLSLWALTAAAAAGAQLWCAVQALDALLELEKGGWLRWGFYAFWGAFSLLACHSGRYGGALTALCGSAWVYVPLLTLPPLYCARGEAHA